MRPAAQDRPTPLRAFLRVLFFGIFSATSAFISTFHSDIVFVPGAAPMMQAIASFLQQLSVGQRLLLSAGLVVAVSGVVMLGRIRKAASRPDEPSQNKGQETDEAGTVRHGWVFTRTAAGYATVIIGYHFIVWALPPGLTDLCVPLRLWFVLPAACAAAVGGAWAMERNGL